MPYSIERLIENQGHALVVHKNETITAALDLMIEHDFSQLPVVDENRVLLGMVTYESILRAARSFNIRLGELCVRDAMVNAPFHYREDDLFDLLDELKLTNAVVIIEPGGCVVGVVTNYDAAEFLRGRTEDLMHVEDIEFVIKELIKRTYLDEAGQLDLERLQVAIGKPRAGRSEQAEARKPRAFEDLNLGDYINLLITRDIWNFCAPILNVQKESLYELLVRIRQTRNDLAHFRSEISPRSRDELKYCAGWLRSRYQDYEKRQGDKFIDTLLLQREPAEAAHVAQEEGAPYGPPGETERKAAGSTMAGRSRYAALANWLAGQTEGPISLAFEQIEGILGSPLPASARELRAWWANDRLAHAHSILWLKAGWKVTAVDLDEERVVFARLAPAEGGPAR